MTGKAERGSEVAFGEYGLKALEPGWIKNTQIEAARIAMTRHIRRGGGKVWIRIFPDKPVTENRLKLGWVQEKAHPNTGWLLLNPAGLCLKSAACQKNWPAKRCGWQPTNCPLNAGS